MKGWLMSAEPGTAPGDTTPWYASFWDFCRRYCQERFGDAWHLSAEQSLLVHAEHAAIPKQVVIHSPQATNDRIELLFGTSFFALRVDVLPPPSDLETKEGLRVYRVAPALVRASPDFFARYPLETEIATAMIRDPSELLERLLDGRHAVIAGRLAGLLRRLGKSSIADEILSAMKSADHDVREIDPLEEDYIPTKAPAVSVPPLVVRLQGLWASTRDDVIAEFSKAAIPRLKLRAYLRSIDDVYEQDAYHSLSIEGYQVTTDLIQRVASGSWAPDKIESDRTSRNALAARGYWLAFQRVRDTAARIYDSKGDIELLRTAHREWYREMFSPQVAAGLLAPSLLAGYRKAPVFIRGSRHIPPRWEAVPDAMAALFDLIQLEPEQTVRAVLGHWLFGYVHPFPDGNGRIARFLMNTILSLGGLPWTVIRVEERSHYLAALEVASVDGKLRPFAKFIASQMQRSSKSAKPNRRTQSAAKTTRTKT